MLLILLALFSEVFARRSGWRTRWNRPLTRGYAKCGSKLQCQCRSWGRGKRKTAVATITLKCPRKSCKCAAGKKFSWATGKCMTGRMPRFNRRKVKKVSGKALKKCLATPACKSKLDAVKSTMMAKRIKWRAKGVARHTKRLQKQEKYLKKMQARGRKLKGVKKVWNKAQVFRAKLRLKYMRIVNKRRVAFLKKLQSGKMGKRYTKRLNRKAMWNMVNGAYMKKLSAAMKAWRASGVKKTCNCTDAQKKPKAVCPKKTFLRMRSCKCPGAPKPKPAATPSPTTEKTA